MNEISVVIPTFNRPELLIETLQQLGRQSVAPREVVVVDNGTRPTALAPDMPCPFVLRYFRICAGAGAAQARNFGAALASSHYVAFLDDDDYWEPDYIERLSGIVNPGADRAPAMVVARIDHLDNGDRHFFRFAGNDPRFEACFYFNPGYLGSTLTVERATFLALGGFDVAFKTAEDKELAMRFMLHRCPIQYDPGLVAINRVHAQTLSRSIDHVQVARLLLQKYGDKVNFKIRARTWREAYKKSRRKRYLVHKFLLKLVLALAALRSERN